MRPLCLAFNRSCSIHAASSRGVSFSSTSRWVIRLQRCGKKPHLRQKLPVTEPVVDDVEPTEECVDESPEDALVDLPTQYRGDNRTNAAEYAAAATATALFAILGHFVTPFRKLRPISVIELSYRSQCRLIDFESRSYKENGRTACGEIGHSHPD